MSFSKHGKPFHNLNTEKPQKTQKVSIECFCETLNDLFNCQALVLVRVHAPVPTDPEVE